MDKNTFLEYDHHTGIRTDVIYDPLTDETTIAYSADVEDQVEASKALAGNEDYSKDGIKGGWWHYAHIPASIILKWKFEKGVDVYNKDHSKAVWKLINDRDYSYLKCTTGVHELR